MLSKLVSTAALVGFAVSTETTANELCNPANNATFMLEYGSMDCGTQYTCKDCVSAECIQCFEILCVGMSISVIYFIK